MPRALGLLRRPACGAGAFGLPRACDGAFFVNPCRAVSGTAFSFSATMTTPLVIPRVDDLHDAALAERLQSAIDNKTKPLGALGRLEALMLRLGLILGTEAPTLQAPQMLVCAGDHGLAARGVSAYPSDVTWQMVENFLAGGAAVSVLARQHGVQLLVADCGVARAIAAREAAPGAPRLLQCRVAAGTQDASQGPAMDAAQCAQALAHGVAIVRGMPGNALLLGLCR